MGSTSIEWTDKSWPVFGGCKEISPGCVNCYAARLTATRLRNLPKYRGLAVIGQNGHPHFTGETRLHEPDLAAPLRWRKPSKIFVNDMSDLFYEGVSNEQIAAVFGVMAACRRHTFQVLTKRAKRMAQWFEWMHPDPIAKMAIAGGRFGLPATVAHRAAYNRGDNDVPAWPPPNVWIGVSVEDQKRADERIPHLLRVPAAVRFLSCEPLLEHVDISAWLPSDDCISTRGDDDMVSPIHWVIVGGESGPGARPFDLAWARSIVAQCKAACVACFVKQLGARPCEVRPAEGGAKGTDEALARFGERHPQEAWFGKGWTLTHLPDGNSWWVRHHRLNDKKGGDVAEWPEDLRVREWPEVSHA